MLLRSMGCRLQGAAPQERNNDKKWRTWDMWY
jgi:hypothetical protein